MSTQEIARLNRELKRLRLLLVKHGKQMPARKARSARFELRLTGEELKRWTALADKQGISLAELVREAVATAIARGSSR